MELTVYWTQFAEDKLEDIFDYYSFKASLRVARNLVNEIVDKSINLESSPFIGQKEPLLSNRPQEFRYFVHKNYKIIYWLNLEKKRVEIVNVFDCRQNPEKTKEI